MQRVLRDEGYALVDVHQPTRQQALIHRHCPPSIGNLFATPREGRSGSVEWWTELPGQPRRQADLTSTEQAELNSRLTQRLTALGSLIEEMARRGDAAVDTLRALPTQPGEDTLYSVGGDPVLIRWAPVRALASPVQVASAAAPPSQPVAPLPPKRRWLVPVMLPLLLGGLALLGLLFGLQHWQVLLPWPNGQAEVVPLSIANEGTHTELVLGTGDVQVTLRWNRRDDLDLAVTAPNGETASFTHPSTPSGGQLDVDSNSNCRSSVQNAIENVFWDSVNTPEGEYLVSVSLFKRCNSDSQPIPFELFITLNGETKTQTGAVDDQSPRQTFEFDFP